MLLLLRFFRSSKVAIRVVSIRRESDENFGAASLSKLKKSSLFSNKELRKKRNDVSKIS